MDFDDFAAVYKAYAEQRDTDFKDAWQRMRMLAAIVIQPHLAKGKSVTPEKLLPLPWDKKQEKRKSDKPRMTAEEQRARMAELARKLGDTTIG